MTEAPRALRARRAQRGQTILLVAVSLVAILGMAALAIDVVTLYVARREAQRAADAAALAGAQAFVASGVTTDPSNVALQTLAQNLAARFIDGVLAQNKVAGRPPLLASAIPNFTNPGSPQIVVTVQQPNLPTFFTRIWGRSSASVTATATAEAVNASSSQTIPPNVSVPIAPRCVKPFLIPNEDPSTLAPFIDETTGVAETGRVSQPITLTSGCDPANPSSCTLTINPPAQGTYVPAPVANSSSNLCPGCAGSSTFERSVECCVPSPVSCGGTLTNATVDTSINPAASGDVTNGLQCLIHKSGSSGQDILDTSLFPSGPLQIAAGSANPLIGGGSPVSSGSVISASDSIMTIPIFIVQPGCVPRSSCPIQPAGTVIVIGFLQVFADDVDSTGALQAHILNIIGCGNNPGPPPVVGSRSFTPIPVRLIH
jgi:hypothetical protein